MRAHPLTDCYSYKYYVPTVAFLPHCCALLRAPYDERMNVLPPIWTKGEERTATIESQPPTQQEATRHIRMCGCLALTVFFSFFSSGFSTLARLSILSRETTRARMREWKYDFEHLRWYCT